MLPLSLHQLPNNAAELSPQDLSIDNKFRPWKSCDTVPFKLLLLWTVFIATSFTLPNGTWADIGMNKSMNGSSCKTNIDWLWQNKFSILFCCILFDRSVSKFKASTVIFYLIWSMIQPFFNLTRCQYDKEYNICTVYRMYSRNRVESSLPLRPLP